MRIDFKKKQHARLLGSYTTDGFGFLFMMKTLVSMVRGGELASKAVRIDGRKRPITTLGLTGMRSAQPIKGRILEQCCDWSGWRDVE